jgi:hypothetical protein
MRIVCKTKEIAHLWANKTQATARNPQGNLYFTGDWLYSYRDTFPIGRHVKNKAGETAVMVGTDTYSSTTSGHSNMARQATRHMRVFHVPLVGTYNFTPATWFKDYRARVKVAETVARRAKVNATSEVYCLESLVNEANDFAAFYGLKSRIELEGIEQLKADARVKTEAGEKIREERRERNRERWAKQQAEREKGLAERLRLWLSGDSDSAPYTSADYLRIKGDEVQTSRGVSVPVAHAIALYQTICKVRERGEPFEPNGHTIHIGLYTVSRIDADGTLHAGCHTIAWGEVDRIGRIITNPPFSNRLDDIWPGVKRF